MNVKKHISSYITTVTRQHTNRRCVYHDKLTKLLAPYHLERMTTNPPALESLSPTTVDGVASYKVFNGGCLRFVKPLEYPAVSTAKYPLIVAVVVSKETVRYLIAEVDLLKEAKELYEMNQSINKEAGILQAGSAILYSDDFNVKSKGEYILTKKARSMVEAFIDEVKGTNDYLAESLKEMLAGTQTSTQQSEDYASDTHSDTRGEAAGSAVSRQTG